MSAVQTLRNALYGNPPVEGYQPDRNGTIEAFSQLVQSITTVVGGISGADATAVYATRAELYADLAFAANSLGLVYSDTDSDLNGVYIKVGSSGSGSWTFTGLLGRGADASDEQILAQISPYLSDINASLSAAELAAQRAEDDALSAAAAADNAAAAALATDVLPGGPCASCATTNTTLSGIQTIDGITGVADQRVLLTAQTTASQNGPWLQKVGAWVRPSDFDGAGEAYQGVSVFVTDGSNGGLYVLTTAGTITIGTTSLKWVKASGALPSQGITVPMPPLNPANGSSVKTTIYITPPSGMINSAGGDDAVPVRYFNNVVKWTNGPAGMENYYNTVNGFGVNIEPDLTRSNTASNAGIGAGIFFIEASFIQSGGGSGVSKAVEFNWDVLRTDESRIRPLSIYAPADRTEYETESIVTTQSALLNVLDGKAIQRVQFDFTPATNSIFIDGDGGSNGHPVLQFGTNNRFVARQRNAAGSATLPLPFINANNNIEMQGSPVYIHTTTGATPVGSGTDGAAVQMLVDTPTPGAAAFRMAIGNVTGNFDAMVAQGSVSGRLMSQLFNTGAGAGVIEILNLNGSGNDGVLALSNAAGPSWVIGRDNSDGNKLKIENSYRAVGNSSNLFVEFDPTAGTARFAKPPRIPAYAVGSLPSASTVGVGALAYATDLNSTTAGTVAAGGGSNKGQVMSDGAAWRIVAAWA